MLNISIIVGDKERNKTIPHDQGKYHNQLLRLTGQDDMPRVSGISNSNLAPQKLHVSVKVSLDTTDLL